MIPSGESPSAQYLAERIAKLSRRKRRAFTQLSSHGAPGVDQNIARWKTNSFKIGPGSAVFLKTARFNHGCLFAKNVAYNWNEETEMLGQCPRIYLVFILSSFT
jgi:hypothetical protein